MQKSKVKIKKFGIWGLVIGVCLVIGVWSLVIAQGCGQVGSTTSNNSGQTTTITSTETTSQVVSAATGGTITVSDGSSISFPAGSLPADKNITVTKLGSDSLPDQVLGAIYATTIESLSTPAIVTLKYDTSKVGSDQDIIVGIVGGATPSEEVSSSEVSVVQIVSPESIDTVNGTITVKTNHFSWVWAFCQDNAYLVFDYTEFMYGVVKPGDIIFALTGAGGSTGYSYDGSWTPGHVAIYVGTEETGTFVPGLQDIMESTVSKVLTGKNGVQYAGSNNFKRLGHIFLGARRPKAYTLTDSDRTYILTQARKMLGWPYFYIDFDNFGIPVASGLLAGPTVGITCVGFVEKAYEDAGLEPLVSSLRQYLFFPIELFTKTKPITDITIKANGNWGVEFYVYGVVRNNYLTFSKWRTYLDQASYYSISASSKTLTNLRTIQFTETSPTQEAQVYSQGRIPTFVSSVGEGGTQYGHHDYPYFYWYPTTAEVGSTYDVTFTLDAGANGTKTETVNITVVR